MPLFIVPALTAALAVTVVGNARAGADTYPSCFLGNRTESSNARQGMCLAASGPLLTDSVRAEAYCVSAISCDPRAASNGGHCNVARAACVGYAQGGFLDFGKVPTIDGVWRACSDARMKGDEAVDGMGRVRELTCFGRARTRYHLHETALRNPWTCRSELGSGISATRLRATRRPTSGAWRAIRRACRRHRGGRSSSSRCPSP